MRCARKSKVTAESRAGPEEATAGEGERKKKEGNRGWTATGGEGREDLDERAH